MTGPIVETSAELAGLAAAARRSAGGEAVMIGLYDDGDAATTVGRDGGDAFAPGELQRVLDDLRRIPLEHDAPRTLAPEELGPRTARSLRAHGIVAAVAVALPGARGLRGVLCVLHQDVPAETEALAVVFARHAEIALAHNRAPRPPATRDERLEHHDAFDRLALTIDDLGGLSHGIAQTLSVILGVEMTGVMVYDPHRQVLQMIPGSFGTGDETAASYQISVHNPRSNAARVFATGQPYLSNDAPRDTGIRRGFVEAFGIERLLTIPLRVGDRPIGVLHVANKPGAFAIADVVHAHAIAPRVASAVELARTFFTLQRQRRLEGLLAEVAIAIASGHRMPSFLPPVLEQLCAATEASLVAFVPAEGPALSARCDPLRTGLDRILLDEARSQPGVRADVIVPTAVGDPGWATFHAPVVVGEQRAGTVAALRQRGEPFSQHEREALTRLAGLLGLASTTERFQQQRAQLTRLEERQRIADDLHDDVAQILFVAQLQLETVLTMPDATPDVAASVRRARELLVRGDEAIRTAIHRLSPPGAVTLDDRLAIVVSDVERQFAIRVRLDLVPDAADAASQLTDAAADALARAAREALVNAAKHACPSRVDVTLRRTDDHRLELRVVDDGVGLDRDVVTVGGERPARHGLTSMRRLLGEQGGDLEIRAGQTGGTVVSASVPV